MKRPPDEARGETERELAFHLEMRVRDYMREGLSEQEARAAARRRMGDLDAIRRECDGVERAAGRARRRRARLEELVHDLRFAIRSLRAAPTFASMAALTLALGIGATTAMYSLVHAVLLAPLPYPDGHRLVRVWETSPQGATRNVVSPGNVRDWQVQADSFDVLAAHRFPYGLTLTGEGPAERVVNADIEPAVLRALGVAPAVGTLFSDVVEGNELLLSHAFWESRFGADLEALGRHVLLDDVPHLVVGVLPPGFAYPAEGVQVWRAFGPDDLDPTERTSHNYTVLGRLAPGVSLQEAQAEMSAIAAALAEEHPAEMTGWGVNVVPLHADLTGDVRPLFLVLLGGVGVVLLIVCASLANLLLARGLARARELALRAALGAGRGRLVRQLLAEAGVLAAVGAIGALLLSPLLLRGLVATAPDGIPFLPDAAIHGRMLAFTGAAALGCALLFGVFPALKASGVGGARALRAGRGSTSDGNARARSSLLVAQVALSVLLLIAAGLFVRSFRAIQNTAVGFDPERLLMVDLDLPRSRYAESPEQSSFYERLSAAVEGLPGVAAVATTSYPPGSGADMTFSFTIEGREAPNPSGREDDETLLAVSPGYFETMGQRVVEGRGFVEADHGDGAPVLIVNESLARKHWPEGGAVGQRIAFRVDETPWREIVGVVADDRLESPDVAPRERIYIPFAQKHWSWLTWSTLLIRVRPGVEPTSLVPGVRDALEQLDPGVALRATRTAQEAFYRTTAETRFLMTLVTGFGGLALLLSVVGLYGLITYSVERERREIGVRMALGARPPEVVRTVLTRSLRLSALGAVLGIAAALAVSGTVRGLLYGVEPVDVATYAGIVGLVLAVAALTAALPAARAARVDPVRALSVE